MAIVRPAELVLGPTHLVTPAFFPSVSSVKTALPPAEYLAFLHSLRDMNRQILVSAFDVSRAGDALVHWLSAVQDAGTTILMDSGNYESYWKDEQDHWRQEDFHDVLRRSPCAFALSFDEQNPPTQIDACVDLLVERWHLDQAGAGQRVIVPIVHGDARSLPELCTRVAHATQVPMLAVAERRLGDGIFERTRSVLALRKALDGVGRYVGLHLLGTGNPLSIALYCWAGADSFDGLEWCQTVVDHDSGLLFHLSQSDFFRKQTVWGEGDMSFYPRALAHNLSFYSDWMQRLRSAAASGDVVAFCRFNLPARIFCQSAIAFGWDDVA